MLNKNSLVGTGSWLQPLWKSVGMTPSDVWPENPPFASIENPPWTKPPSVYSFRRFSILKIWFPIYLSHNYSYSFFSIYVPIDDISHRGKKKHTISDDTPTQSVAVASTSSKCPKSSLEWRLATCPQWTFCRNRVSKKMFGPSRSWFHVFPCLHRNVAKYHFSNAENKQPIC